MNDKIKKIADHYGYQKQKMQLMEEMGELMQAINRYDREERPVPKLAAKDNIAEEIADVKIMLDQIEVLQGLTTRVASKYEEKVNRQLKRIEQEKKADEPAPVIWAVHGINLDEKYKEYCWRVPGGMTPPKPGQVVKVQCCGQHKNVMVTRNDTMPRREALKHKSMICLSSVQVEKEDESDFMF